MIWHSNINSDDFIVEIGKALAKIDNVLMALLTKRGSLSRLVEEWKHVNGNQSIIREKIEDERLEVFANLAKKQGVNPNFAKALLYLIIIESCKTQTSQMQARDGVNDQLYVTDKQKWLQFLKTNLLALTTEIAGTYGYDYQETAPHATKTYLDFEGKIIANEVATLQTLGLNTLAIDLGCAIGRVALKLTPDFEKVIGYDISPDMIRAAESKKVGGANFSRCKNVEFIQADIEEGIHLEDNSASLIIMNMGTASDIHNIKLLIARLKRVLEPNGRFVLSFYNSNALPYQWFIPWSIGLRAEIDPIRHCLNVQCHGKIFQIYARPYTPREIRNFFKKEKELSLSEVITYPTIAAMLPDGFFKEKASQNTIKAIDKKLAPMENGAYILVTGRKVDKHS